VRPPLVVCALALVLVLGACDGGGTQNASSTSTTTTTTIAPQPAAAACPGFHGTMLRAASAGERPVGLLTDASAGAAGCLDVVTFTFRSLGGGTPPGYVVEYKDPPFSDGDPPREVTVDGSAFLSVVMTPAASVDVTKEDRPRTYFGNLFLRYDDHHHFVVIRKFDDVLGTVQWVIALDEKRPFVVDSAANPTRISIYIG
jgi:hypothetical protein